MKNNIQIVLLSLLLMGIVFSIYKLQTTGIDPSLFFLEDPRKDLTQLSHGQINLCRTRISKIEWALTDRTLFIFQKGTSWFYSESFKKRTDIITDTKSQKEKDSSTHNTIETKPLKYKDDVWMEKWLGEFCTARVDAFYEENTELPYIENESITFHYIDNSKLTLKLKRPWILWGEEWIKSSEMNRGLSELHPY